MILKASQRGGGKQLGLHLLKTEENEHVEVHEIRGFVSEDIVGALKEAYAVSQGTRCKQFLFSVSLNPPESESVPVETFEDAVERIETKNGLTDQPRVIVFHEKEGRRHAHAVWSRIDTETMTARNLSHFKLKLRNISKELYLENDWTMPRGFMDSKESDPRNYSLVEYQQAKRLGREARDLKGELQECWAVSDSRAAFAQALKERGMILAKGDRRGHVAVTHEGEKLSIARYVGKKAKEVRAKLGEPGQLPSVHEAKTQMAQDMGLAMSRHLADAREVFQRDMAPLDERRRVMTSDHQGERQKVDAAQKQRWDRETRERQERFNKGFRGIWDRLTGRRAKIRKENEAQALAAIRRDREQRDALVQAQLEDRQRLQAEIKDFRQRQAELLTELRQGRQIYRQRATIPTPEAEPRKSRSRSDTTQAGRHAPETPQAADQTPKTPPPPVHDHFARVAQLRVIRAEPGTERPTAQPSTPSSEDRLQQLRNNEAAHTRTGDRGPEPER